MFNIIFNISYVVITDPLVDVINLDKLCVNLLKGFDFTGGQSFHFSHRKLTSRADCDAQYSWDRLFSVAGRVFVPRPGRILR